MFHILTHKKVGLPSRRTHSFQLLKGNRKDVDRKRIAASVSFDGRQRDSMGITVKGAGCEWEAFEGVKEAGAYLRRQRFGEVRQVISGHEDLSDEELLEHACAWSRVPGSYWRVEFGE